MYTVVQQLFDLASRAGSWFDSVPLDSLFLVAIAFRVGARKFGFTDLQVVPYIFASLFLVAYFLHLYAMNGSGFSNVLASLLRSVFAYHIVWSVCMIAVGSVYLIRWLLFWWQAFITKMIARWRLRLVLIRLRLQNWRRRRHPLPLPPPRPIPAPVPRAVILRRFAEAAESDYDAEIAALDGLPLDEDEREVLICAAKQRLIRKLNQNE